MSLLPGYVLTEETPPADDYRRLRSAAGLSAKNAEAAERGLPNTLYAVSIRKDGALVGMGRAIGDGGLFVQVVDIAVEPAEQGRGLGKAIMGSLMAQLRAGLPQTCAVSLLADGEAHRLYAQYGFALTAPDSLGMSLRL